MSSTKNPEPRPKEPQVERLPAAAEKPWLWPVLVVGLIVAVVLGVTHPWFHESEPSPTSISDVGGGGSSGGGATDHFQEVMNIALDVSGKPGTVNAFWAENFPTWWPGKQYTPPTKLIPYNRGEVPANDCGAELTDPKEWEDNAVYCRKDGTISYENELMTESFAEDDSLPVAVLAHEWTHMIAQESGFSGEFTVEDELYADCGSGLYFAYAGRQGMLDTNDVSNAAKSFFEAGSTKSVWFDPGHHGTPLQRWTSFMTGYRGTISDCFRIGSAPPVGDVVLQVGSYRLPLVAGAKATKYRNGYQVNFPDTQSYVVVYGGEAQDPVTRLNDALSNSRIVDANVRQLNLSSEQLDLGKLVPGTTFAAERYTFTDAGKDHEGLAVASTGDSGGLALYAEGPSTGQTPNGQLDQLILLMLAGIH
jgi:predicted metalloprotease